jgi:tRNA-specific 2-thiouridylase
MTQPLVAVAMSGGVDSSVSALLLKRAGFRVIGLTMCLFGDAQQKSVAQARAVAAAIGIEHRVIDLSQQFASSVVDYFSNSYRSGDTPNPCVTCNRTIKFGALLEYAEKFGANYLATGHYARIDCAPDSVRLLQAIDANKDQSYFLYGLDQHQLSRAIFPLGACTKSEVRRLAEAAALPSFPGESQDICFLGGGDYRDFLRGRVDFLPGDIVDAGGVVLGRHRGLGLYTIGQRKGLGISSEKPLYVVAVDRATNRLIVDGEEALMKRLVHLEKVHWIAGAWPADNAGLTARIRYRMPDSALLSLEPDNKGGAVLTFIEPVRAVTPGQSAVIYQCDEVLGGGIITG